ncbi:hypothetical protein PNK_2041 [Candidatus Protochlamydia naegleriophila]|uniref:Uncharacterized protein n=1 Tax=Candidatus Protochlamydia naegleriophila TaxID=389348 RepID=A0A0U5JEU6_9BACT|nr:hypothetical protein [Candidatus Protochlamydia naegleriophila]CUI17645.1 hypothetical protein PNK_2041 [Candidatus Protochlamydia naegleriophila]
MTTSNHIPATPSLGKLPYAAAVDILFGYAYGVVFKVDPKIPALALAAWTVADCIILNMVSQPLGLSPQNKMKMYTFTHLAVNAIAIAAWRHLKLINQTGTIVLSALAVLLLAGHLNAIQHMPSSAK